MSRRGRRSVMGGLGAAMRPDRRRRRKDRLIAASGFGRKKRGHSSGLAAGLDLGDRLFSRRRRGGITSDAVRSLRDRLSPTERAEIRYQVDRAIDDDRQLSGQVSDAGMTQQESFITRLVRAVRERIRS